MSPVGFLWCRQYRHGQIELNVSRETLRKENTMKKYETFSERLFAEARLCRNLGDIKGAEAWERQAQHEKAYEDRQAGVARILELIAQKKAV